MSYEIFFYFSLQERQVKLAYVTTEAKPPPAVRRKQAKFGTGTGIHPGVPVTTPSRSMPQVHHRNLGSSPAKKQAGTHDAFFLGGEGGVVFGGRCRGRSYELYTTDTRHSFEMASIVIKYYLFLSCFIFSACSNDEKDNATV